MIPKNGSQFAISEGESCRPGKLHLPFADGATLGAPQATQVADRWHILSNLGDAVEEFLIRAHIRLEEPATESRVPQEMLNKPLSSFSATPACQRKSQARLLRKWKLYQRVQELHAAGMSLRKIGEELGLARNTVRKYASSATRAATSHAATAACQSA